MANVSGLLVSVRTAKQGAELEKSKLSDEYRKEISSLRINAEDMAALSLSEGDYACIKSPHGEITVTCQPADVPRGLFFIPLGILANQVYSAAETDGTGVPDWKRQPVTITPGKAPEESA